MNYDDVFDFGDSNEMFLNYIKKNPVWIGAIDSQSGQELQDEHYRRQLVLPRDWDWIENGDEIKVKINKQIRFPPLDEDGVRMVNFMFFKDFKDEDC